MAKRDAEQGAAEQQVPLTQADYPSLAPPEPRELPPDAVRAAPLDDPATPPRDLTNFEQVMVRNSAMPPSCESPDYLMVLNGLLFLDKLPARQAVVDVLQAEMLFYVRFRSVLLPSGKVAPCQVDLDHHVRMLDDAETVAASAEDTVQRVSMQNLDPDRPRWEVLLVPRPERPYCIMRVHHAVGDGFALSSVFERLLKTSSGAPIPSFAGGTKVAAPERKAPGARAKCTRGVTKCCRGVAIGCDSVASFFKNAYVPKSRYETDHHFSPLGPKKGGLVYSGRRKVILFPRTKLEFIKQLKTAAHSSVNDVMMGCFAGAVREYGLAMEREAGGQALAATKAPVIRALVPFGMPLPAEHPDDLRNNFAFVSVPLAVAPPAEGPYGPAEARVKQTQKTMAKFKRSTMAPVSLFIVNKVACKLPLGEQQKTGLGLFARHSVVYSNVPGPAEPVFFAGQEVTAIQCVFMNQIPQIIIISYAGEVDLNLTYDPELITKPELFVELYTAQFLQLAGDLGVSADGAFS